MILNKILENKVAKKWIGSSSSSAASSAPGTPRKFATVSTDPLSTVLDGTDPLSHFASDTDPLSKMAAEYTMQERVSTNEGITEIAKKKVNKSQ